jgi:hypothetical protein
LDSEDEIVNIKLERSKMQPMRYIKRHSEEKITTCIESLAYFFVLSLEFSFFFNAHKYFIVGMHDI